jgi:hypothetical protein
MPAACHAVDSRRRTKPPRAALFLPQSPPRINPARRQSVLLLREKATLIFAGKPGKGGFLPDIMNP